MASLTIDWSMLSVSTLYNFVMLLHEVKLNDGIKYIAHLEMGGLETWNNERKCHRILQVSL